MDKIIELILRLIEEGSIIKIILSGVRKKSQDYQRVVVRPVLLRQQLLYQVEYHYTNKVTHENLDGSQILSLMTELIEEHFKQINIFSKAADYQIIAGNPDRAKIIKKPSSKILESLDHNEEKEYIIPQGEPCDFLIRLGVMASEGKVLKKNYNKFRQINKFLEIISDVLDYLPDNKEEDKGGLDPLRIVDFGCGKAYLTFALYYYLKLKLKKNVEIIGLDLKEDVIDFCNQVASDLNYKGLSFLKGDIADYTGSSKADMVVTLHACDTATDYALIKAVSWQASVILSVPCCQHELFNQLENQLHYPLLKHGLLKDRFASILTDGLRALKLEEAGYQVAMVEFTSLEHTAKNIMIRAVKTNNKNSKVAGQEYRRLKEYWNVDPTIDQLG